MLKYEDLKTRIQPHLSSDFDALLKDFSRQHGTVDLERFLMYLNEQSLIETALFREIHSEGNVALTGLPSREPTADEGATQRRAGGEVERYELIGIVGEGGVGRVHLARDTNLGRKIAFKELKPEAKARRDIVERFLNEAQITAQLDHPNVVPIYAMDADPSGRIAYAMKLVQGKTLKELIEACRDRHDQGLPMGEEYALETRLDHFLRLCDALSYAHSKGVIHRDLKPANVMVGRYGEVYLMDWGIARLIEAEVSTEGDKTSVIQLSRESGEEPVSEPTRFGETVGTPRYMSPEQAAGFNNELDSRSDQYSLGNILQELVTLQHPVTATSLREVMTKVLRGDREPVAHYHPKVKVPAELKAIIHKSTRRDRDERYETVRHLAEDVRRYLRDEETTVLPDTSLRRLGRWIGKHRGATLMALMGLLLIAALGISAMMFRQRAAAVRMQRSQRELGRFLTAVSSQTQRMDRQLLSLEAQLTQLAGIAGQALTHGAEQDRPIHRQAAFVGGQQRPADLTPSPHYRQSVSLDWPVFVLPPTVAPDRVRTSLRQLSGLGPALRTLLLASRGTDALQLPPGPARRLLLREGAPITAAFIGLSSGAFLSYPGRAGFSTGYDPRNQRWYKRTANRRGLLWGTPYMIAPGQWRLPCTTSIYDDRDRLLGVAGVEIGVPTIVRTLLHMPGEPAVRETLLVDAAGRVLARVRPGEAPQLAESTELPPLPQEGAARAIRGGLSGFVKAPGPGGRPLLVVYHRLSSMDWHFVVVAEPERLGDRE